MHLYPVHPPQVIIVLDLLATPCVLATSTPYFLELELLPVTPLLVLPQGVNAASTHVSIIKLVLLALREAPVVVGRIPRNHPTPLVQQLTVQPFSTYRHMFVPTAPWDLFEALPILLWEAILSAEDALKITT